MASTADRRPPIDRRLHSNTVYNIMVCRSKAKKRSSSIRAQRPVDMGAAAKSREKQESNDGLLPTGEQSQLVEPNKRQLENANSIHPTLKWVDVDCLSSTSMVGRSRLESQKQWLLPASRLGNGCSFERTIIVCSILCLVLSTRKCPNVQDMRIVSFIVSNIGLVISRKSGHPIGVAIGSKTSIVNKKCSTVTIGPFPHNALSPNVLNQLVGKSQCHSQRTIGCGVQSRSGLNTGGFLLLYGRVVTVSHR